MGNVYYTGSLTPSNGGGSGTDPNEILAGTVVEGKFSDLPTFFAGLEGKYCNGTVTYKITEDETITSTIAINFPETKCRSIVIDGNDCDITHDVSGTNFLLNVSDTSKINTEPINIVIKDCNFIGSTTVEKRCLTFIVHNMNVNFNECNFKNIRSTCLSLKYGNFAVTGCVFNEDVAVTTDNKFGIILEKSAYVKCIANTFTNLSCGFYVAEGSFISSCGDTFTNLANKIMWCGQGSFAAVYTESSGNYLAGSGSSSTSNKWVSGIIRNG